MLFVYFKREFAKISYFSYIYGYNYPKRDTRKMYLRRKGNAAVAESVVMSKNLSEYIRSIIDIYSAIEIDKKYWLTTREQDFFICSAIHVLDGIHNPISNDALQIYKKYFNPTTKKKDISYYLNKLRKKKWIKYDIEKKIIYINSILDGLNLKEDRMDFEIRLLFQRDEKREID